MSDELRKLNATLAETKKELNKVKCKRKRLARKQRDLRKLKLPENQENIALLIYSLANYNAGPAAHFLEQYLRATYKHTLAMDVLCKQVEELFVNCDETQLAADCDAVHTSRPLLLAKAQKFLAEWRMYTYVERQNLHHGVAPTTQMLLERKHFEQWGPQRGAVEIMEHHAGNWKGRRWALRWRTRWQIRIKSLRAMEDISLEDRRKNSFLAALPSKTRNPKKKTSFFPFMFRDSGPKIRPMKLDVFWDRPFQTWSAVQKAVPKNGTHF